MSNQSIIFEQPVNELTRVCLRVEYLLHLAENGLHGAQAHETLIAVSALADILTLTDRLDLRGKFTKEFLRQQIGLQRFLNDEHIDQTRLQIALTEINQTLSRLQSNSGKFGAELRDNEFLTNVRQHLMMPGGVCSFDTPAFFYWMEQPVKERHQQLTQWFEKLDGLFEVVQVFLQLIRQSGQPIVHTAHEGFYQASLDPQMLCQLIRVAIPHTVSAYPEISVGRHGVSIRFYHPTQKERGLVYNKDISFRLTCCIL